MAMSKLKESVVKTVDDVTLLDQESEDDILEIVGAVSRITAKYRQLGIGLGLLPSKIDEIEKKRKTSSSVRDKLSEVIRLRLDQLPAPTWKTFIDAAKPINPALAERVARTVPGDTTLDVRTVTEKFKSISAKYYQFGANLKVPTFELDGIRSEMSIHDLLHDVVLEFLTSRREKYKSTWRTIVDAVFDINPALAKEIAEKHKAKGQAPSSTTALKVEGSGSQVHESPHPSTASTRGAKRSNGVTTDGNTSDSDDHSLSPKRAKPISVQEPQIGTLLHNLQPVVDAIQKLKLGPLHQSGLTGHGIGIYVLDGNIDMSLDAFQNKTLKPGMESFVDNVAPITFHGTACAALATGTSFGVAPGAVLNVCVVSRDGINVDMNATLNALWLLIDLKKKGHQYIDIISMSFGDDKIDENISKCIEELTELGMICIAAAGNDGVYQEHIKFPASDKNVISVGARQPTGQLSSFNPHGNIDVYAPGENISQLNFTGTSAAAPIVAGITALLLQCGNHWQSESRTKLRKVDVLRKIFDDMKAPGKDLLAPHTLLQRLWKDPGEVGAVLSEYIKL